VVADALAAEETFAGQGDHGYLLQLRQCPALPAKANLLSRLAQRSETPLYIDLPNPMREVSR
jgi:siderophore synthetase component